MEKIKFFMFLPVMLFALLITGIAQAFIDTFQAIKETYGEINEI